MRVAWITIITLFLTSCGSDRFGPLFDESRFENSKYNYFLAFDLAFDSKPIAALVVKNGLPEGHYTTNIHLAVTDVRLNKNLFSTVGQYGNFFLVDFDVSASSPPISAISFLPILTDADDREIRNYGYRDRAYLLKRGLERQFVFSYRDVTSFKELASASRSSTAVKPQSISVNLPDGAKGIEIGSSRKTSSPDPIYVENDVYFYPYSKPATGEKHLEIKYMLKETPAQELIVDGLIKLILVLIPGGVALLLIQSEEIINPDVQRYGLYFCGVLAVSSIGGLLFYSFYLESKAIQKGFVDIGIAVIAAILTAFVFYTKKKRKKRGQNP